LIDGTQGKAKEIKERAERGSKMIKKKKSTEGEESVRQRGTA